MLKDLMQAIFTEEVETDDENEAVEVSTPTQTQPVEETFVEPKIVVQEPTIASFSSQPKKEEQPKQTIFSGLDVDSISSEEPRPRKKVYKFDRSKTKKARRTMEDLEYKPVISPIFGNMEENKKDVSKVHNAIDLAKPEQLEDYMDVISPMYGKDFEQAPVQSIPRMETKSVAKSKNYTLDQMLTKSKKNTPVQKTLFESEEN